MFNDHQILKLYPTKNRSKIEAAFDAPYNLWRRLHRDKKIAKKTTWQQSPQNFSDSSQQTTQHRAIAAAYADNDILLLPPAFDIPYQEPNSTASLTKEADGSDRFQISASDALLFIFMIPLLLSFVLKYLFVTMIAGTGAIYLQLFIALTFMLIVLLSPLMILWGRSAHDETIIKEHTPNPSQEGSFA